MKDILHIWNSPSPLIRGLLKGSTEFSNKGGEGVGKTGGVVLEKGITNTS